ncbi:MAG TPA: RNA polymerase sigma factor [Actinomycetota bacterium]|nr:RNA polymerase sigma factor [Actinomycetota bacterium]
MEDKDLALAFQRGDESAYGEIYDAYEPLVRYICRKMLYVPEDAQEASQETFLRVYRSLGDLKGRYNLRSWIGRIATNVCLDRLRSEKRHIREVAPLEDLEVQPSWPREASDPAEITMRAADRREIGLHMALMPPHHRTVLLLRDLEGHSYADIAEILGMTDAGVKALIHRARRGFRRSWTATASADAREAELTA